MNCTFTNNVRGLISKAKKLLVTSNPVIIKSKMTFGQETKRRTGRQCARCKTESVVKNVPQIWQDGRLWLTRTSVTQP